MEHKPTSYYWHRAAAEAETPEYNAGNKRYPREEDDEDNDEGA
jgi:hypothetical protein